MTCKEFMESNGVHYDLCEGMYVGEESIVGKKIWVCSYCSSRNACGKATRNIPPTLVEIFPLKDSKKKDTYHGFYQMPVFVRKLKNGKPTGPEIGFLGNSCGDSDLYIFEGEEECRTYYAKQLADAEKLVQEVMVQCKNKLAELDKARIEHCG